MPPASDLLSRFPKKSTVSGLVSHITGSGAVLFLGNDVYGRIPARELSWTHVDHPRRFIREGQQVEAIVTGVDLLRNQLILSRRLALGNNPWDHIADDYPINSIHPGRVTQIESYGAFVELEPGIVGLTHVTELPIRAGIDKPIELWANDHVLVQVLNIDLQQFRISLSIKSVVEQRDLQLARSHSAKKKPGSTIAEVLGVREDPLINSALPWYDSGSPIRKILLVDNEEEFGRSTVAWMKLLGYRASYVKTCGEARLLLDPEHHYDLLLVDYELDDGNGLELASFGRQRNPNLPIVLLSGQAHQRLCQSLAPIPGLICWSKPFMMSDFNELLLDVKQGTCRICQRRERTEESGAAERLLANVYQPTLNRIDQLSEIELSQLLAITGAEVGFVFTIDRYSNHVGIVARAGSGMTINEADLPKLLYSPVKDVCVRGEVIRVADMCEQQERFRYLLPLGNQHAFLAVPVRSSTGKSHLGIFLFHHLPDTFSEVDQQQAIVSASFLGLQLERQEMLRTTLASQQMILAGWLSASLAHEVRGQITTISSQVDVLNATLNRLRGYKDLFSYADLLELGLSEVAANMQRSIRNIRGILNRQLDFVRPYTMSSLDINDQVDQVAQMVVPIARRDRQHLTLQFCRGIPPVYSASLVIQQIFLNLALNAIQQMTEVGIVQGELRIRIEYKPETPRPIRVQFSDTGPGIHAAYFDSLFQLGFTTRADGTGQGLYISRAAAEAVGGKLIMLESFVGFGTTFELELPLRAMEAGRG